jgi:hypothetical protein
VVVILYFVDEDHIKIIGRNSNTLGCIFFHNRASIKTTQTKEATPMDSEPYIQHITQMLRRLPPEPLRAVYMVVKEYDVLVSSVKSE